MEAVINKHPGNVSIQTHCTGRAGAVPLAAGGGGAGGGGEMNNWGFQMLNELWPEQEVLTDVRHSNDASHYCRF